MQPRMLHCVFRRQFLLGLVASDHLVLRSVVHKHAPDVLYKRCRHEITDKYCKPYKAFEYALPDRRDLRTFKGNRANQRGQHKKQADA
ncbi:hypothetical protein SDC9_195289 [bioreactor metagenome]|uniref:Uncharacterized protein n=1 Tax=bioreactor metagenome TaxID=1076179 RepID=A0A645I8L3_9ZZZZ